MSEETMGPAGLRLISRLGSAVERAIRLHEARCPHRPRAGGPSSPPLPFSESAIPRDTIIEIAERLSTCQDMTIYYLAEEYGYPVELLERVLADYEGIYRRELRRRARGRHPT